MGTWPVVDLEEKEGARKEREKETLRKSMYVIISKACSYMLVCQDKITDYNLEPSQSFAKCYTLNQLYANVPLR